MNRRSFLKLPLLASAGLIPPLPTNPKRILVCEGNSLTARQWPLIFVREPWLSLKNFQVVDMAIGGSSIKDLFYRASVADSYTKIGAEPWIMVWEYTNTLQRGISPEETYQLHKKYCSDRHLAGFKVLVGTAISRMQELVPNISEPTRQPWEVYDALNQRVRNTWTEFADGIVDFAAVPELGSKDAPINKDYFRDGVHLTNKGNEIISKLVLKELQSQRPTYYIPQLYVS